MRWKKKSLAARVFAIGWNRNHAVSLIESVVNDMNLRLSYVI
jgi:hypothetical protein